MLSLLFHRTMLFVLGLFAAISATAQAPAIVSFTPASGPVGTIVTINGSNFNTTPAGNIVLFGGIKAVVNTATANTLTVTVPYGASYQPFTVLNTSTNLSAGSKTIFRPTFLSINSLTAGYFDPIATFNSGPANHSYLQQAVILDDFDGDGRPDVFTTNVNSVSGYGAYFFRNTSTAGTMNNTVYATPVFYATGDTLSTTACVADLDGDGKKDVVIYNMNRDNKVILRNTSVPGTISFAPRITINMPGNAWGLDDVDGDGKPDIVTGGALAMDSLFVLRNLSTPGNISFSTRIFTGAYLAPYGASTRFSFYDIDGDGKKDLLYPGQFLTPAGANPKWSLVTNRNMSTPGNFSFGPRQYADSVGGGPGFTLAIADFDGDNKPDVAGTVTADYNVPANANKLILWRNTSGSNISFAPHVSYSTGNFPILPSVDDFDGDGKPDLAVANGNGASISIFRNVATPGSINASSFAAPFLLPSIYPTNFTTGDADADGKPDVLTLSAGNILVVQRNNPPPVIRGDTVLCNGAATRIYIISEKAGISSYQWEVNTGAGFTPIINNAIYSGATTDTLRINSTSVTMSGYQYRLKNVNNAQNKTSWNTISLTVNASLVPVIINTNNVLSTTGTYAAYQWERNNTAIPGATSPTYTVTRDGSYTLSVTAANGCKGVSAPVVISTLSVNGFGNAMQVNIYPNPANDYVHVEAPVPVNVLLTDVAGRKVLETAMPGNIAISHLPAGVYLVKITDKDGLIIKTERLVKQSR